MSKAAELANLIGNINAGGGGVNRNLIINGAMNVAQRGTSSTGVGASSGYFTVDRFKVDLNNTAGRLTITQDSSAPSGFANSTKLACTTADTSIASDELLIFQQRIEGQNLQAFAKGTSDAKPFALSFYAKANASKTYVAELFDNDNSRQVAKTFTVGTDWARHEITLPADTTGAFGDDANNSMNLNIWLHAGSNFTSGTLGTTWQAEDATDRAAGIGSFFSSTDNTFFITGVQLEVGQNPTEFEHEPFEVSLIKCKRYFERINSLSSSSSILGVGFQYNNDPQSVYQSRFSEKRTTPSLAVSDVGHLQRIRAGTSSLNSDLSSISFNGTSKIGTLHDVTSQSNNLGDGCYLRFQSTSGTLDYDAEL